MRPVDDALSEAIRRARLREGQLGLLAQDFETLTAGGHPDGARQAASTRSWSRL